MYGLKDVLLPQHDHIISMQDVEFESRKDKSVGTISNVKDVYKPQRRYRRQDAHRLRDEELKVQSTLLEYGRYTKN